MSHQGQTRRSSSLQGIFVGSEGIYGRRLNFLTFFFNIAVVVFNFDKLGKVASKRNPNPNLDHFHKDVIKLLKDKIHDVRYIFQSWS